MPKVGKLSEAQRRALRVFVAGYTATTLRPEGGSWWSGDANGERNPSVSTLFALQARDLIHADYSDWRWIKWTARPRGRLALSESEHG